MNTQDLIIRSIKIIDIAYLTVIFLTLAVTCSIGIDKLFGSFDKKSAEKKSTLRILFEIYGTVSILAILAYVIKKIVELIPFPLDGFYGFEHKRMNELNGGAVFSFALFLYQYGLRDKINYLITERFHQ